MPTVKETKSQVIEIRNRVIHSGETVSESQAREALFFVKNFIYEKFPPSNV